MIYLFDKDEKLIKIVRKSAVKTALQKYALTTERYVSDRLTAELKGLNADELEQIEYMAIQTMEDAHTFHYFYVAQKSSDELTALIGVQSGIEELRKSPVYDKRPQNALARDVITDLLAGTNWQARFVGETTAHSTNFYYTSVFDALKKVCDVWDLEMQFFVEMNGNQIGARYIDFKQRIGEAVGKRVVYGHNALQILQEVERTNIYTALVGRGKVEETTDGYGRKITFENVVWSTTQGKPVNKPAGQKYLELPLMTMEYGIKNSDGSMRPKIGFVDFSEEENPEVLIERTYKSLVDAARPQLTLKTSSVYLKGVKVGDTIRVVRHDKKLDYDTRVFEITFNRLNNQSSDIKLGDRIGESNEAKAQTIADKAVEQFVNNEFSNFVQNLPDYLPSADGFNNNWYGAEDPTVQYPGKVLINDIWYKSDPEHEGHKIMLRWTGEVWEEILRTYDSEALRDRITEEIAQVNASMQVQSEEHDRQVADILSKTQSVESLANQAKTDAANAMARANQVKTEAIADATAQVATVSQALNIAKTDLQNQVNAVDAKAVKVQSDANALRTDLNQQAQTLLSQAQAQTALTSRVTTVETLADGTKTTVTELSKTVSKATGDIASVTGRTKTVEDTLSQTRTQYEALTQTVNTQTGQIESINRKTADLKSGISGVTERFESLQVGNKNYLPTSRVVNRGCTNFRYNETSKSWSMTVPTGSTTQFGYGITFNTSGLNILLNGGETLFFGLMIKANKACSFNYDINNALSGSTSNDNDDRSKQAWSPSNKSLFANVWTRVWFSYTAKDNVPITESNTNFCIVNNTESVDIEIKEVIVAKSKVPVDYQSPDEDTVQQIAEYKRTADQNYAGLQSTISTLDGKVTQNKTEANQTATQLSNRLTSLETYKDAEGTRAQAYFEASKTETAKQLATERTAISANYVAKSTYDENVSGTTLKLNEIKTTADTAKQNLATYQETVDRKLTELTTSTQTLDGKINTASAKVDTVAGQIRTEISEVEGNIPTEIGGRNLAQKTSSDWSTPYTSFYGTANNCPSPYKVLIDDLEVGDTLKSRIVLKYTNIVPASGQTAKIWLQGYGDVTSWNAGAYKGSPARTISGSGEMVFEHEFKITADHLKNKYWNWQFRTDYIASGSLQWKLAKVEKGTVFTGWSLAPEDLIGELSSVKTTITQTASGVEQLSTSLSTTNGRVTTAETKISQLISDVSSKVSQTDYNTLTGRVSSAETAITQNATEISKRLTSTQVSQAILVDKQIKDTRSDNQSPQWYWTNYPKQTVEEFKASAVIGLTSESTYAILTTNVQWKDSSGGKVKQTAKTDRATFERYGTDTTWEAWTKIANAGDLENYTTKTEFQTVKETTSLYERVIGSTEVNVKDKIARIVMADSLFMTEVKNKVDGTSTQVTQLADSYAIKNLTNSGTVLNQLNLNKDGSVRIDGKLVQITGTTYIEDGVIRSAKIASLDAGKITTGYLASARIATNSITGSHIVFDQAFVNKMTANEALFKQLFAQSAFITQVQAVTLSAEQIAGGILTATNGAMKVNLNAGQILYYTDQAALKRVLNGYPTQFIKFGTGTQSTDNAFRLVGAGSSSSIGASIASFGTNRNNGENNLDGGFTGVNIYAGGTTGTNVVDRIELASDILQIAHAASTGIANDPRGWTFENQNSVNNNYVFRPNTSPNSAYKALIGTSVTPINELYIDEAYIKGQRLGWILKDIANRVGHGGWANYIS